MPFHRCVAVEGERKRDENVINSKAFSSRSFFGWLLQWWSIEWHCGWDFYATQKSIRIIPLWCWAFRSFVFFLGENTKSISQEIESHKQTDERTIPLMRHMHKKTLVSFDCSSLIVPFILIRGHLRCQVDRMILHVVDPLHGDDDDDDGDTVIGMTVSRALVPELPFVQNIAKVLKD